MSATVGQAPGAGADLSELAENLLRRKRSWSSAQRRGAAKAVQALVRNLPAERPCAAGLAGAPGSGKSALAELVCAVLREIGTTAITLSLDDYYLGKKERAELAKRHELFSQRGVPGTHDWTALVRDLDRLRNGDIDALRLPRFDKLKDDRAVESSFRGVEERPRVVILEGWLIGAPPQDSGDLRQPVNRLEAEHDPDGTWRRLVNQRLGAYHEDLAGRLDRRWFLAVPDWQSVINWRWLQEREGSAGGSRHLQSRQAVAEFLDQFQRIAQHMIRGSRDWADMVILVDENHVLQVD